MPAINFAITPRSTPTAAKVEGASGSSIAKAIVDKAAKSTFALPSAKRSYLEITKEGGITNYNEIQSIQGSQYYQRIYSDDPNYSMDGATYLFSQSGKHYWATAVKVSGVLKTRYLIMNDTDFAQALTRAETDENHYGGQINVAAKARYTALHNFDGSAELPAGTTFYSSGMGNLAVTSVVGSETLDLRFDNNLPIYDYSVVNKTAALAAASSTSVGLSEFNWAEATPLTPAFLNLNSIRPRLRAARPTRVRLQPRPIPQRLARAGTPPAACRMPPRFLAKSPQSPLAKV